MFSVELECLILSLNPIRYLILNLIRYQILLNRCRILLIHCQIQLIRFHYQFQLNHYQTLFHCLIQKCRNLNRYPCPILKCRNLIHCPCLLLKNQSLNSYRNLTGRNGIFYANLSFLIWCLEMYQTGHHYPTA